MQNWKALALIGTVALASPINGCLPEPDCAQTATCPLEGDTNGDGGAIEASVGTFIDASLDRPLIDATFELAASADGPSVGSDSGPDGGGAMTTCMPGDRRCSASAPVIQQCDLTGIWRDTTNVCPYACTGTGANTSCTGSCIPGTKSCGPNETPTLCDDSGTPKPQSSCLSICLDGACKGECKPDATKCVGSMNMVQTCDSTGQWGSPSSCTFVCDVSTNACGGECAPGSANRCSGNIVQQCDGTGHWTALMTCSGVACSAEPANVNETVCSVRLL